MLANFMVNTNADPSTFSLTDSEVSLREAIFRPNEFIDLDNITFSPTFFNTPKSINLTQGELTIAQSLTIDGRNPNNLAQSLGITIEAAPNNRIFNVTGGNVTLSNLTLTGGNTSGEGGAIRANNASLTVQHSTITNPAQFSMRSCAITALAV